MLKKNPLKLFTSIDLQKAMIWGDYIYMYIVFKEGKTSVLACGQWFEEQNFTSSSLTLEPWAAPHPSGLVLDLMYPGTYKVQLPQEVYSPKECCFLPSRPFGSFAHILDILPPTCFLHWFFVNSIKSLGCILWNILKFSSSLVPEDRLGFWKSYIWWNDEWCSRI